MDVMYECLHVFLLRLIHACLLRIRTIPTVENQGVKKFGDLPLSETDSPLTQNNVWVKNGYYFADWVIPCAAALVTLTLCTGRLLLWRSVVSPLAT